MRDGLRIAIQKKGRLADGSIKLLEQAGLGIFRNPGALTCRARGLPIELLFVRDDDIASLVAKGVCDLGIAGENVLQEEALENADICELETVRALGFSYCTLKLAAAKDGDIRNLKDLSGKRIATSYPQILGKFLAEQNIKAECVTLKGAVEIAPALEMADAICDLVSSGATLAANGLVDFATVMQSEALLVRSNTKWDAKREALLARLLRRMDGVIASRATKYIMLNAPKNAVEEITALLPGADAPTIMPLAGKDDQVAVHAVCRETIFWDTLEQLEQRGAHAILVLPIEKMMG
ncbi:ATP phosphoribosyltransferase =_ HisGl [hydrothermal vent metagenome]|uniref:ATP phosphoribosyltransferase n=1 Tax=hydrothermal vent metagenome TaxID=652676 RepID=A0A3B0SK04_9ZZZZ